MAERVGSATVEVNADLRKLFDGLDKAKRATNDYVQQAARQFNNVTSAVRTASMGMQTFVGQSTAATTAMQGLRTATAATTSAVNAASTGMRAFAASTPIVARSIAGVSAAAAAMSAAVAGATSAAATNASKASTTASALSKVGLAMAGITAAATAAGASVLAFANRSPVLSKVVTGLGVAATAVAAGFAAVAARAGPALAAAWRFANHPLGIFTLSALAGSPILGAGMAIASTAGGRGAAMGVLGAGTAIVRGAASAGIPGVAVALTAVGAAVYGVSKSFGAMADGFRDARKASADLKAEIEALNKSAEKMSEELPAGALRDARLRGLRGATGGLTSPFATMNAGLISSEVIEDTDDALKELTLRMGSAERASVLLSQALQRPERAIRLLSDVGIVFTDTERKMLEQTRTLTERLENAETVIAAVNRQLGNTQQAKSSWMTLMYEIGKFLGSAPGALWTAMVDGLKAMAAEIARFSGLVSLVNTLDSAFKGLADTMRSLNIRLFGGNVQEEIRVLREGIAQIDKDLAEARRRQAAGGGFTNFITRPVINQLEEQRQRDMARLSQLELGEVTRLAEERNEIERRLNVRIDERLRLQREELEVMQAGNRAQLEAFRIAREEGIPRSDPRVQEMVNNLRQIEMARRRIAQANQLSVFDRENIRLEHQVQLFRYGNEEMERRTRLLQIQIAAAQRQQALTEAQSAELLRQLELKQRITEVANTINEAFTATFNSIADALAQFASTGKFKFKELADSIVQQLVRIAIQLAVIKPLLNSISSFVNPTVQGVFAPGAGASPIQIPSVGGFAEGGSFTVPGGRTGDQPYLIGLSAGERVNVTPGGKGGATSASGVTVNNIINSSRDFEVETRERESPDGSRIIEQVFSEVTKRIGRGDMDTTMGARYGLRSRTAQR